MQIKGTSDLHFCSDQAAYGFEIQRFVSSFIGALTRLLGGYIGHRSPFQIEKFGYENIYVCPETSTELQLTSISRRFNARR